MNMMEGRAQRASNPDAKLVVVEECGHLPTLERPDAVNLAMRKWLEQEG